VATLNKQTIGMTSQERVLAACAFHRPDRIPRFDGFWEYPESWRQRFGPREELTDVAVWCPAESTFPSRARRLKEEGGWIYEVEEWGRTQRRRPEGYFAETLEVPMPAGVALDSIQFDSPAAESRYLNGRATETEALRFLDSEKRRYCVFGKTGGPYLRSTFVRGETQFLMDIAGDPPLAKAIADKVGDHLTAVGVEEIRRWSLAGTGIWIYDDMAYNHGPMFRPESFEKVLLPAYRRMIAAYKAAGARYVFLHSDGDIRPILPMLVEAGIDGINPLERRANMDVAVLRKHFPRLILTGGMDNTDTLIHGPIERIRAEAREIIDLGRDGGIVIGTHSVSPEIPMDHFAAYLDTCLTYGNFGA
jgi:uroporphyrinogen decarboxylase